MQDSFTIIVGNKYFIDKSLSLKGILDGRYSKFLFTRPRRWGKTTFQLMLRDFLSMHVDKNGKEIENHTFDSFKNLKLVANDRVNIKDLLFLKKEYDNQITEQGIEKICDYFAERNYPWFLKINQGLSKQEKLERVQRLVARAREGLSCSEEEFKKMSKQEIKKKIEELRKKDLKGNEYFKLLSTFGEICKHYKKYPTIFVEFPEVFELQLSPGREYDTSLETEIKNSIAKAFKAHKNHKLFLENEILKQEDSLKVDELKTFEAYLNSQASPNESLTFLSESLQSHYQIPTVLIIDEYDKPMNHAFRLGETRFKQVRQCLATILSCVKNEQTIRYVTLTGVNRLPKSDMFSGLNNLTERGIFDQEDSECFGFTASEVKELVKRYNSVNRKKKIDYDELKLWYNNYQTEKTFYFNPFSVTQCLLGHGKYKAYWTESGSIQMIPELFKKIQVGKEQIADSLLLGEVHFCAQKSISWEEMKQPTQDAFLSLLLHTGYLSLARGETIDENKISKFVVPNKEIKDLIEKKLMVPFYKTILEQFKCNSDEIDQIVKSTGTNEFIMNLNDKCLNKVPYSQTKPQSEAYFESMVFGIIFVGGTGMYFAEVQKTVNRRRIDSVFYPGNLCQKRIAVLHEYKVCKATDNIKEKAIDAIWQCFARNYLKCVCSGNTIMGDKESNWSKVILRGMVFYPNMNTLRWCASSVEYTLSLKEVQDILEIFSCLEQKDNEFKEEYLSGKSGTRKEIEDMRAMFLLKDKAKSLSELIKSGHFCHQKTSELITKAGFSSVKLGFSPRPPVNYTLFDSSKSYPHSAVSQLRVQPFNHSSFKPMQLRSSLLKASPLMKSLKWLSKAL